MGKDKLDDLLTEDPMPLVALPSGKNVCPGHPKICLYAGWCSLVERLCGSCPYQLRCYPSSGILPLTEPVVLQDIRPMSFDKLDGEDE